MEEMPQAPPTKPPTVTTTTLHMTVCICGRPTLLEALQLSMMGLPPLLSHMFWNAVWRQRGDEMETDNFHILKISVGLKNLIF